MAQNFEIQQLLAAEERALKKIDEAKKRKTNTMKRARDEAKQEIDIFKQEKEREFENYKKQLQKAKDLVTLKIEEETKVKIDEMNEAVNRNQEIVIQKILDRVYDIKAELHYNYKNKS